MFSGKFNQGMRRSALLWALVAACGAMMSTAAHAMRDGGEADAQAPLPCSTTARYEPPSVPWMGTFYYEVSLRYKDGVVEAVDVSAARGTDTKSDSLISNSLEEFVKRNYTCAAGSGKSKFYLGVTLKHDLQQSAERHADELAARERTSAAAASGAFNEPLVYANVRSTCTRWGRPEVPRVNVVGTLVMNVEIEVTNDKVSQVNAKLKQGSRDARLNQQFINAVTEAITKTYVCSGNIVFTQEFTFKLD